MKFIVLFCFLFSVFSQANSTLIYEAEKKGLNLTEKDKETLEIGEISTTRYVVGGVIGTYPLGLGIGHAIQGRWSEKGWIFTAGELASGTVFLIGALGCVSNELENGVNGKDDCNDLNSTLLISGVIGFVGFRIWEIIDVWATPPSHNKKFKELKKYIDDQPAKAVKSSLYLSPLYNRQENGTGVGLTLTF